MDSGQWTVDKRPGRGGRSVRKNVCNRPDMDSGQWTVDKPPGGLDNCPTNLIKTQQRCERTSLTGQWTKVSWTNVYCLAPRMVPFSLVYGHPLAEKNCWRPLRTHAPFLSTVNRAVEPWGGRLAEIVKVEHLNVAGCQLADPPTTRTTKMDGRKHAIEGQRKRHARGT